MIRHSPQNHRFADENIRNYIRKMYISGFIGEKPVRREVGQIVSQVDGFHGHEGEISENWVYRVLLIEKRRTIRQKKWNFFDQSETWKLKNVGNHITPYI